jgi:hypothetical protein
MSGSYAFNHATAVNDGTASAAASNWSNTPVAVYINDLPVTRSNFDVGHRVNVTAVIPIRFGHGLNSAASFFYNGQSGRPYVLNFNGDANSDTRTNNDIVFAPSDASQVNVLNGTYAQLDAFLSADCGGKNPRGVILERNSAGRRGGTASTSATLTLRPAAGRRSAHHGCAEPSQSPQQGLGLGVLPAIPGVGQRGHRLQRHHGGQGNLN